MANRRHEPIMEDAERLLGNFVRPTKAWEFLVKKHGITERTAKNYLRAVRERWRVQGADLPHEERAERKAEIRRALRDQYAAAVEAGQIAKEARNASAMATAARAAAYAAKTLSELDGLITNTRVEFHDNSVSLQQVAVQAEVNVGSIVQEQGRLHGPAELRARIDELVGLAAAKMSA